MMKTLDAQSAEETLPSLIKYSEFCYTGRANAWNVSFETLNGGQFALSTHLIKQKLFCYIYNQFEYFIYLIKCLTLNKCSPHR